MPSRPALAALLVALATPAAAHIQLVYPPARSGTSASPDYVNQKVSPCGLPGRSANVTTLAPGATITVLFDEIIEHPGEFRIAFDPAGDDDLAPPAWDGTRWSSPPGVQVLAEHVPDLAPGVTRGEVQVTLPSAPCTDCTLQLIQVMTDRPFTGGNFYFMCADVVLAAPSSCGDGVVDAGEACDDGNVSSEDACLASCVAASCGDGFVRAGVEACDDGNAVDGDGCSASCAVEPPAVQPPAAPPPAGGGASPSAPAASSGGCGTGGSGALGLVLAALGLVASRRLRSSSPRSRSRRTE